MGAGQLRSAIAVAMLGATVVGLTWAGGASAQSGPSITLDRSEVSLGEPVIVSMYDFTGQQVTVAVCGNLGKRGSTDCNMTFSQSEQIRPNGEVTLTQLFVEAPPVPCPCIIRASTSTNDEFAITPIMIIGHPTAPLVDNPVGPLIEVSLAATHVPKDGLDSIRDALGGPAVYELTVSVRNVTTETLSNVELRGSVGNRFDDNAATLTFDTPGPIDPGQTWEQTVTTKLPAPVIGRYTWTVAASGAGETVEAEQTMNARPVLLYVLVGFLVIDVLVLGVRFLLRGRRHRRRAARADEPTEYSPSDDVTVIEHDEERVLIG